MSEPNDTSSKTRVNWDVLLSALEWNNTERRDQDARLQLSLRAAQYAEPTRYDVQELEKSQTCLTFKLGKERYAVDIAYVRGVQSIGRITRVPGAPDFYPGVINVRGRIVTVFDMRRFFGLSPTDDTDSPSETVQIEVAGLNLAMLADHVEGVINVPHDAVEPLDILYARGITTDRLVVLDLEQLAGDERLIINGVEDIG